MRITSLRTVVLAVMLSFLAVPTAAQSFWLEPETSGLSLEVLNPTPEGTDFGFLSFAMFATAAVRIGTESLVVVELPFSRAESGWWGTEAETALGNPYIGIQTVPTEATGVRWSAGVRVPLASDASGASGVGVASSASDRYEAFIPDLFAVNAAGRYVGALGDMAYASGRFGALGDLPTGDGDAEIFLQYGAKTWIESQGLRAGLGLSGRYLLTESGLTFGQRTLQEVGIWADYDFGSFRPGIRVQLPVGTQMSEFVDNVIGIYVRYESP